MNSNQEDVPLPLEIVSTDEAFDAVFGDEGPTPFTPLGSAMLFWQSLLNGRDEFMTALTNLSQNPAAFGDYSDVEATLVGYSIMEKVEHPDGHEANIGYVRFIRDTGHSMRAFADATLDDIVVLTMVSQDGQVWRVWGYSHNYFPSIDEIHT